MKKPEDLNKEENARLVIDFIHRIAIHYGIWFSEVIKHLGREKAYTVLENAWKNSYSIQMSRLAKTIGFEMIGDIPTPLLSLTDDQLNKLRESLAVNWLANDGVWFQAVEFTEGMTAAKICNDNSWSYFSPFEALSIKRMLNLAEKPGLDGLKQALQFRLYALINKHSITEETPDSFIYLMNDCRVQSARKRKNLEDYPCKSAGIIEYTEFAQAIDARIKTKCICCPPDKHPKEYYCAWKFEIEN